MSHFKITVIHNGERVDVFPWRGNERDTSFGDVCQRIGMMVMSNAVTEISVYRDGEIYRTVQIHNEVQVKG